MSALEGMADEFAKAVHVANVAQADMAIGLKQSRPAGTGAQQAAHQLTPRRAAERDGSHSGLWHTASILLPSGSSTKAA